MFMKFPDPLEIGQTIIIKGVWSPQELLYVIFYVNLLQLINFEKVLICCAFAGHRLASAITSNIPHSYFGWTSIRPLYELQTYSVFDYEL